MRTITIHDADIQATATVSLCEDGSGQFIGRHTIDGAPNEFVRRLVAEALRDGTARARDPEGCFVTATRDPSESDEQAVSREAPWAARWERVEGGVMCWESVTDYETWTRQQ